MSELETVEAENHDTVEANVIPLSQFVEDFGDGLLEAVARQNPPVYDGHPDPFRDLVMEGFTRDPFPAQRDAVQAVTRLLVDAGEPGAVINAEMGTGKTMMAIATAGVMHAEGARRFLVISPPHLVYKWRREIKDTLANARVWVLNGPDTLRKLLAMREMVGAPASDAPEFYIIGRVRMRMGFHWKPTVASRRLYERLEGENGSVLTRVDAAACPDCGTLVRDEEGNLIPFDRYPDDSRRKCPECGAAWWSLIRPGRPKAQREMVRDALMQIPTIGQKSADRLLGQFGEAVLEDMLSDNLYEFVNLMDENGDLVFGDRQAARIERRLATLEFSFGQGGYQPTEFIKRQLPPDFFDLLIVDEGHEYKNEGSAQGQAMGVLANKVGKVLLLTGTLMGGYASDLFFLLWRIMPQRMVEDGFRPNARGSLGSAAMAFMREHGVLKDIYKESESNSHRTARGKRITVRTAKGPGFGPQGIARYVLPYTVFLKLKDIGSGVLPPYDERYVDVAMEAEQASRYRSLESTLTAELKQALRTGDNSLLGVVLNTLLAWPDTCFREEVVKHPRTRALLSYVGSVFGDEPSPKEQALIDLCRQQKALGRRVLAYTVYTGTRDTTARLKALLQQAGLKVGVLKASVDTSRREDWIMEQVEKGIDVLVTNPELVKTGLDLLDFPTIAFLQTGYNVYTLQQAARRSWRIGQTQPVEVVFLGYAETAQTACLSLMASKIAVSQSTSGDMPETGLDVLNQDGDSIEVALAKQLAA
ncbi:DEAD/DEAH box helicase family protein [Ectothiorhodospira variabilis]|uniref:DEAD/DEAH box helicase family protein n=1 Tax=Ectothiorhodospira variabilis TaxID=505694 RepID=UPI001EFAAB86|nr:DEAD/DEAH box helicase family protein [Ectothiorhodospira variabilis]MCG5495541.1 DEAD/DEAH box helicase family protein [Ectothiorhodospira variabilis]MCG5505149.1 DEAD/DEAH box helicase family protein [Ectothiorhodospira variabilis]MCG5508306.1 DEAD/DEAH box helicase family protein [Ectothiorhodospira variabilis]